MSKKKPAKRKKDDPADDIRAACQSIVNDLYAEVARVSGPHLESLTKRFDELKTESDAVVGECNKIVERIEAVERKIELIGRRPARPWLDRMRLWFR